MTIPITRRFHRVFYVNYTSLGLHITTNISQPQPHTTTCTSLPRGFSLRCILVTSLTLHTYGTEWPRENPDEIKKANQPSLGGYRGTCTVRPLGCMRPKLPPHQLARAFVDVNEMPRPHKKGEKEKTQKPPSPLPLLSSFPLEPASNTVSPLFQSCVKMPMPMCGELC